MMASERTPLVPTGNNDNKSNHVNRKYLGPLLLIAGLIFCIFINGSTRGKIKDAPQDLAVFGIRSLSVEGDVYLPSDGEFKQASSVWNKIGETPAAVIVVNRTEDVSLAIQWLRSHEVPFVIKSGGHNKAGYSSIGSDGVILSLVRLNIVEMVEEHDDHAIVRIGPVVHGPQIVHAFIDKGWGGVIGACPTVAMGGFTLGGGYGWLSRKHGLASDNLVQATVVLASGDVVVTNECSHADLLWALQGAGGGNFGVVTEMVYKLHPAQATNLFGVIIMEQEDAGDFLHAISMMDQNQTLPRELSMIVEVIAPSSDLASFTFPTGSVLDLGMKAFATMRQPVSATVEWFDLDQAGLEHGKEYIHDVLETLVPSARSFVNEYNWKKSSLGDMPDVPSPLVKVESFTGFVLNSATKEELAYLSKALSQAVSHFAPYVSADMELWGGAMAKPKPNTTGFVHREHIYNVGMLIYVEESLSDAEAIFDDLVLRVGDYWKQSLAPYLVGAYSNYQMRSLGDEYAQQYWRSNLERLQRIKTIYDKDNLFQFPQSIPLKEDMKM